MTREEAELFLLHGDGNERRLARAILEAMTERDEWRAIALKLSEVVQNAAMTIGGDG